MFDLSHLKFEFSKLTQMENHQIKSLRSQKVIQLCSCQLLNLKSSMQEISCLDFLVCKNKILQTTFDDKEIIKTKVVDLEKS